MKRFANLIVFLFFLSVVLAANAPKQVVARDCLPGQFCYLTCEEVCQKFPWEKICPCRKPSPTLPPKPTPTPTQVVQPTPTPTSIPSEPTPTLVPGEPTPTPIPSVPAEFTPGGVGGGPSEPGLAGPLHCGAQTPPAPDLKYLKVVGGGKVELLWDPVEPVTSYNISYGPSSGNYLYGVPDTGKTTSFTVGNLGSGNYCFIVRAVNGCAPSGPSNEVCTSAVGGAVLGARTKVLGATGGSINEWLMQILGFSFLSLGLCLNLFPRLRFAGQRS